jgi:hypothetical protein
MPSATRTNPLAFLTDQLDELKAIGTHFKLRVLGDNCGAGAAEETRRLNQTISALPTQRIGAAE